MSLLRIISNKGQGFLSHFIQVLYKPRYQVSLFENAHDMICTMDDVRGYFLRPLHGTTSAAAIRNKNRMFISFKSKEKIQNK